MRNSQRNRWRRHLVVPLLLMVVTGCGGDPPAARHTPVTMILWDCSGSFTKHGRQYLPDIATITAEVTDGRLVGATVDGKPVATIAANMISVNLAKVAPEAEDAGIGGAVRQAKALGFARRFRARASRCRPSVRGSALLQALQLASRTPGVEAVWLFSDGLENDPARGFNPATATRAELQAEAKRWISRLRGLAGVRVSVIGAETGTPSVHRGERSRRLFVRVMNGVDARLTWQPTLAQAQ